MNAPIKAREKFFVTVNVTNGDSATGFFDVILKVIKYIFKSNCGNGPYSICGTEFTYTTIPGNYHICYIFSPEYIQNMSNFLVSLLKIFSW